MQFLDDGASTYKMEVLTATVVTTSCAIFV